MATLHAPSESETRRRSYESFDVVTLTPHLGAEVPGIDLSGPLTDAQWRDIDAAWADWGVLVFRDQHLGRDEHKAFARHFGSLHEHPMHASRSSDTEVLEVRTTKDSPYTAGNGWHSDVTCDEIPPLGSALYITETPEVGGGDTLFADMALAFDLLSPTLQRFLETLTAVHDGAIPYRGAYGAPTPDGGWPKNEHPVVTVHPVTGRKTLFVNPGFTSHLKGLAPKESRAILDLLYQHTATTPRLICRVEWRPNTLALWDNRAVQHHAVWDYWPHSRYGERVSIVGTERPAGVSGV